LANSVLLRRFDLGKMLVISDKERLWEAPEDPSNGQTYGEGEGPQNRYNS